MNPIDSIAYFLFGKYIRKNYEYFLDTRDKMRRADIGMLVEQYISQACLMSLIAGIMAAITGILIGFTFFYNINLNNLSTWNIHPFITSNFPVIFSVLLSVTFFVVAASLTYYIFISILDVQANVRSNLINQSLPHTTAYLYALSRGGGLNLLEIMRSITKNHHIYGAAAEEIGYIVKDMECYGTDLLTALEKASYRTPSHKFKDFIEGLNSIVTSGGDVAAYLKAKNEQYRLTALKEQKIFFETLGVLAEVYISAFVAGPLFLITILVVLGLINPSSASILNLIVYVIIPISTVVFILLLNSLTGEKVKLPHTVYVSEIDLNVYSSIRMREGGVNEIKLRKKFKLFEKLIHLQNVLLHPFNILKNNPSYTFFISLPIALIYIFSSVGNYINLANIGAYRTIGSYTLSIIDDHVFVAMLILLTPFIIFDEIKSYRIRQIEAHIPEFLKNLASINEAGILLVDAIQMSMQMRMGVLHSEVRRLVNDISWGSKVDDALRKFEYRIRTEMTRRIITLIIKANETTGDIKSVLTIAARDADIQYQLKKERNAEMFVYVFIIYISFMVFLFIVYILAAYFLPAMPTPTGDMQIGFPLISSFNLEAYTMLFFHAALIQGLCSGIVAGKMGNGNIHSGLKHSVLMMSTAYLIFTVLI
jgi:flagellar protein FlaJ